jgi:hypothetical protein
MTVLLLGPGGLTKGRWPRDIGSAPEWGRLPGEEAADQAGDLVELFVQGEVAGV